MKKVHIYILLAIIAIILLVIFLIPNFVATQSVADTATTTVEKVVVAPVPTLDKALYDQKLLQLANITVATSTASSFCLLSTNIVNSFCRLGRHLSYATSESTVHR